MDLGTLRGLLTAALLLLFLGVVFWAYSRRRRADFEQASRLPLEEQAHPPASGSDGPPGESRDPAVNASAQQGSRQ